MRSKCYSIKKILRFSFSFFFFFFLKEVYGQAVFIGTRSDLEANDQIRWESLGGAGTVLSQPFTIQTEITHHSVVVYKSTEGALQRVDQGNGWYGGFSAGDSLIWTYSSPGVIYFKFDTPIDGIGMDIQPKDLSIAYSAKITVYKSYNVDDWFFSSTQTQFTPGKILFMGVRSAMRNILMASIEIAAPTDQHFAINKVSVVIPESKAWGMVTALLLGLFIIFESKPIFSSSSKNWLGRLNGRISKRENTGSKA